MNRKYSSESDKTRATAELSTFMTDIIRTNGEATLLDVRQALADSNSLFFSLSEDEILYRQDRSAYVMEIDELIHRLGADTAARDVIDRDRPTEAMRYVDF